MPDVLVIVLANEIDHFGINQGPHMQGHGPRLRKYLRVIYRHRDIKAAESGTANAFRHMSRAREEITSRVEPSAERISGGGELNPACPLAATASPGHQERALFPY